MNQLCNALKNWNEVQKENNKGDVGRSPQKEGGVPGRERTRLQKSFPLLHASKSILFFPSSICGSV